MPSKGVQDRVNACAPTLWAAFAFSPFVDEAFRRLWPELEVGFHERQAQDGDGDAQTEKRRSVSLPGLMRGAGARLDAARGRMVAADEARERQKATLEEERRQRDDLVKSIYGRVVWARGLFEERAGRHRTTKHLQVDGETPRDPQALLQVARRAAERIADPDVALPSVPRYAQVPEREVGEDLLSECQALEVALKTISQLESNKKGVISSREQQVATFDELHGRVARFLETLLDLAEMPTLAKAVRPELEGIGRRGRPPKKPAPDLFPDLVVVALRLDPDAGLTLQEIRELVPRRPVEYRRLEDVPDHQEVLRALASEAAAFRGGTQGPPTPDRLDVEALGGPVAVEGLKDWLTGIRRAILGRKG